jgi:hypothetical protein
MDFKKLLKIFEADTTTTTPKQGVVGSNLANISGGEFATRADRLNQAKVDAVLGSGYTAGRKNTNLALQNYYRQNKQTNVRPEVAPNSSAYAPTISDRANDVNVAGTGKPASGAPPVDTETDAGGGQDLAAMARQGTAMRTPAGSSGDYTVNADPNAAKVPFTPRNTTGYNASNVEYMYDKDGKPNPNYRSGEGDPAWVTMKDVDAKTPTRSVKPFEPNIIEPQDAALPLPSNVGSMSPEDSARELRAAQVAAGKPALEPEAGVVATGTGGSMKTGTGGLLTYRSPDQIAWEMNPQNINKPYPGAETAAKLDAERKARSAARAEEFKKSKWNPVNWFKEDEEMSELRRLSGLPLNEKAVSVAQQQTAAIELKKRKEGKKKSKSGMGSMSTSELEKFASTKHKNLPKHVTESIELMDESRETLKHIANRFKYETKMFMQSGHMEQDLFHALYDYYRDKGEMPYSVAKGDPQPWVEEHFYMDMGSGMSESNNDLTNLARLAGLHESEENWKDSAKSAANLYVDAWSKMIGDPSSKDKFKGAKPSPMPTSDKETSIKSAPMPKPTGGKSLASRFKNDVDEAIGDDTTSLSKMTPSAPKFRTPTPSIGGKPTPPAPSIGSKSTQPAPVQPQYNPSSNKMPSGINNGPATNQKIDVAPPSEKTPPMQKQDYDTSNNEIIERSLKENEELNQMRRIAGLKECGDMGMTRQQDSMNVSTNMSSDGTKNVTISAQGDKADELLGMLKLAGMNHDHHEEEPVAIITTEDNELLDESGLRLQHKVHSDDGVYMGKVYKDPEWNEYVVKFVKMGKLLPSETWYHTTDIEDAVATAHKEIEFMQRRAGEEQVDEEYANEPEEEYYSVDSILRQGDDLNREKHQYRKEYPGDNPMAESMMSAELEEMLESILLRDDKDEPEIKRDSKTGRVSATFPPPKKQDPSVQELPLQNQEYHGPRSLKVDGERTGTENYGDDDKEIYEEEKPTWLQRQPSKSQEEIAADWNRRMKTNPGEIEAEKPYPDPKKPGKMITPPRGATNPPPDSEFPPGDPRNSRPLNPKGKK